MDDVIESGSEESVEANVASHSLKYSRATRLGLLLALIVGSWLPLGALGYAASRVIG